MERVSFSALNSLLVIEEYDIFLLKAPKYSITE